MRQIQLRISSSPREAWEGAIRDWFSEFAPLAWRHPLPTLVIVPTRSHAQFFKARLLQDGQSHLGLEFVTLAGLRAHFADEAQRPLALREHLRLFLALAAEETLAAQTGELDPERQAANAVLRAPDHLLRTLDRLDAAGWKFGDLQLPSFQPIVRHFRQYLERTGFTLAAETDRAALRQSREQPSLFANALITGFDGAHWPHWFLLQAAAQAAENATIVLEYPCNDSLVDSAWIGSWEQVFGEALPLTAPSLQSSDNLFPDETMRTLGRAKQECTFLVGAGTSEQAEAVARQCLRFLADPACDRVGIVFSGTGALPRLVANALVRLDLPHHDGLAHSVPGIFEAGDWRAWLQLQQSPRINSLLHFINALPNRADIFPGLSLHVFERVLRSAHSEVLLDDLEILRRFCAHETGGSKEAVADALRSISFLPARARLAEFLRETKTAFDRFGWSAHWMEITRRLGDWIDSIELEFPRALYLRWLGEIASTFTAAREPAGDHPYARVQLLTVAQAHGQEWSHLIFAGWNEGSWPPPESGEFAREDEIAAFNSGLQKLNRRAAREGRQGEGHIAIRENHTLYLGPAEQRQIALRQFETLLQAATTGIAFSASLAQENAPERFWNPSELLTRVYQQTHRTPLTQPLMSRLQEKTAAWLENARGLTSKSTLPSIQIEQTRVAYDARRDPTQPAGEYDFAFRKNVDPPRVPVLSVTEIEKLVSTPALIWMKKYLGVAAADEGGNPWAAATGQWAHHWLAGVGGAEGSRTFVKRPAASLLDERIRKAAEEKAAEVKSLCASAGKSLPDWWTSGWQNAIYIARHLAAKIAHTTDWPWMSTEWTIDADEPVRFGNGDTLAFRGRIDLLLARGASKPDLHSSEIWILDYKTGSNRALVPAREDTDKRHTQLHNRLVKGEALQLGLYALAIRQRGAADVFLSLVSFAVRNVTPPQLSISDVAAHEEIFLELARMQQTGVFGMYGQLRPAFGYSRPYPLATIAIDQDALEAKWELTHPALTREEEEWESW